MAEKRRKNKKPENIEPKTPGVFGSEMGLWIGIITTVVFVLFGERLFSNLGNTTLYASSFFCLFIVMLWLSFSVVQHADCLAIKLGEPYGTLILTLSVISIEVIMIAAVMLTGVKSPTLARDTMFAVLMIVLNGMVGVTLLLGGLRHQEQEYNLRGANAYLTVIITLSVLGLVLPRFSSSTPDASASPLLAVFLVVVTIGLYAVFLGIQTMRHRGFFMEPLGIEPLHTDSAQNDSRSGEKHPLTRSVGYHSLLLVASMVPIVLLSKKMAVLIDHGIATIGAPVALGGVVVALLVLSPEGLGALRAALHNRIQRTVNICLGSALATTALTIPAVLTISLVTGKHIELGLDPQELVILALTLLICMVNFGSGRTNILQGAVHLIIFVTYVVLLFD